MAKEPTPREAGNVIDQYNQLVTQLIQEAAAYAASGQDDPETSANIRQLRVTTSSLMAALQAVGR